MGAGDGYGCHALRRSFASQFLKNGGDISELQRLMGHSDPSTTEKYVTVSEDELVAAHKAAHPGWLNVDTAEEADGGKE